MTPQKPDSIAAYHPLLVEGMGGYDSRDPEAVATQVVRQLGRHWEKRPPQKPVLLITQGDPAASKGIAAITPRVAELLAIPRAVVCLDEDLADYHARNADRRGVEQEYRYRALRNILTENFPQKLHQLETRIDAQIAEKNQQRAAQGKEPLPAYYPLFARLQEVVKGASRQLSGAITVAYTSRDIHPFSITSFYTVGLETGLMMPEELVAYP